MHMVQGGLKMKIPQQFIKYIEDNCDIEESTGMLRCNKCHNRVTIDWFEKKLECLGCDEL